MTMNLFKKNSIILWQFFILLHMKEDIEDKNITMKTEEDTEDKEIIIKKEITKKTKGESLY